MGITRALRIKTSGLAAALLFGAAAGLITPSAIELARTPDWLLHPSWNGSAYALGVHQLVLAESDPTGSAAVLATLDRWRGGEVSERELAELLRKRDFDYRLGSFATAAAEWGFPGRWALVGPGSFHGLPTPFLAHLSDGGGRMVIVRRIASGYAYLADPNAGTLLMPLAELEARSSQQVYLFDAPVSAPEGW